MLTHRGSECMFDVRTCTRALTCTYTPKSRRCTIRNFATLCEYAKTAFIFVWNQKAGWSFSCMCVCVYVHAGICSPDTALSDQSDCERRVRALQHQLLCRRAEIEKLQNEQTGKRLHAKEKQLLNELEVRELIYFQASAVKLQPEVEIFLQEHSIPFVKASYVSSWKPKCIIHQQRFEREEASY